ncbi:hypothetical protein F5X98DRAFT_379719 [Xylaria grammica]|nr:hypothetical protein F5X98DRAFT_379719 [Xylaria grammica]
MLRLATKQFKELACRDPTQANLSRRWTNPEVKDSRIDYGIAVAVGTKRLATGVEKANTQLAGFGRCMLRLQHDTIAFLTDTKSGSNDNDRAIVLPLLTIIASA